MKLSYYLYIYNRHAAGRELQQVKGEDRVN